MVKSINSIIYNPTEKLKIQLSVGLLDIKGRPNIHLYEPQGSSESYLTINPSIRLVMKYQDPSRPWDIKDQVYITPRNIFNLREGLKHFSDIYYRKDMYNYDDAGFVTEINARTNDYTMIGMGNGQLIKLEPAIMYDEKNTPYPGIMMKLNKEANEIVLYVDAYEELIELISHMDIRQEGLLLLQIYMTMQKDASLRSETIYNEPTKKKTYDNIFAERESKEIVSAPPSKHVPSSLSEF